MVICMIKYQYNWVNVIIFEFKQAIIHKMSTHHTATHLLSKTPSGKILRTDQPAKHSEQTR